MSRSKKSANLPHQLDARGFTLIELVVVIVLLGILSAVAIPRFVNMGEEAEKASAKGFMGAYEASVHLFHSKWLVAGEPSSLTVGGSTVPMNAAGWPSAANVESCISLWESLLDSPPTAQAFAGAPAAEWAVLGNTAQCVYVYQNGKATSSSTPYIIYYHGAVGGVSAGSVVGFQMD